MESINDTNMEAKEKHKSNFWLGDPEFLSKTGFEDLYYLETLCIHINNYIKNVPIPVLTSYDTKNQRIFCSIGKEKRGFKVDTNIAYHDFITLMKKWIMTFYPTFNVTYEEEVSLTEDEMFQKVKEGLNPNDVLNMTKKISKTTIGCIEKIQILEDLFVLNVNGVKQLRISGTLEHPLALSVFLKQLRKIKEDKRKKSFIFENSSLVKELKKDKKEILITYQGKQLYNFFVINYSDLKDEKLEMLEPFLYKWGNFIIKFESKTLMEDCFTYYHQQKTKESLK